MKVKIFDKTYDSELQPIMLILNSSDKENIKNMSLEATKYLAYPSDLNQDEILEWMKGKNEMNKMNNDNVVVESNKDGSFNVKIKEGETIYEIPHVMPTMASETESDWLVKVTILRPSPELVSSKVTVPSVQDENKLRIGQIWQRNTDNSFGYAEIVDIKDRYIKYEAYYKSKTNNIYERQICFDTEDIFKRLYPDRY